MRKGWVEIYSIKKEERPHSKTENYSESKINKKVLDLFLFSFLGTIVLVAIFSIIEIKSTSTQINSNPKISSYAVDIMTPENYPKTYKKWGKDHFEKINNLLEPAAKHASLKSSCDEVEFVALSDSKSIAPNHIVIFANCKNGNQFHITENDLIR